MTNLSGITAIELAEKVPPLFDEKLLQVMIQIPRFSKSLFIESENAEVLMHIF